MWAKNIIIYTRTESSPFSRVGFSPTDNLHKYQASKRTEQRKEVEKRCRLCEHFDKKKCVFFFWLIIYDRNNGNESAEG